MRYLSKEDEDSLVMIAKEFQKLFTEEINDPRLSLSLLSSMDFLIASGFLDCIRDKDADYIPKVMTATWSSISKTSDAVKKISGGNLLCSILRFDKYCKSSLNYLILLLCSPSFPRVRVAIAEKLHTSLLTFSENCFPGSESKLDKCLELLSETDWSIPVQGLKPIRSEVAALLGVKCPSS
jgi:hypothetical protein